MPSLPRKVWLLVCVLGVALAVVFAILPVGVNFADDPLLRLRQLDPQLTPPPAHVVCGSPVSHLSVEPSGTSLYEVARASACAEVARRRFFLSMAWGALIVMLGLFGLASRRRRVFEVLSRSHRNGGRSTKPPPAAVTGSRADAVPPG